MTERVVGDVMDHPVDLVLGAITAGIVLFILVVLAPACHDYAGEPRSVFCVGGMGEPAWKTPALFAVYLLLTLGSAVGIRRRLRK